MLLFPRRSSSRRTPSSNATETTSAGYAFLFSDPAGEQKAAAKILLGDEVDKFIYSGVELGRLLIQIVLVGGLAFGATKLFATPGRER